MKSSLTPRRRVAICRITGWKVREFLRIVLDPLRLTLLGRAAEGSLDVRAVASSP